MKKRRVRSPRERTIPVRLSEPEIRFIERAADLVGENRTEFMRNRAKAAAHSILVEAGLLPENLGVEADMPDAS